MPDGDRLIIRTGEALFGERWQAPVARLVRVHKDTVQDWRQGRSSPRPGVYADLLIEVRARAAELAVLEQQLHEAAAASENKS